MLETCIEGHESEPKIAGDIGPICAVCGVDDFKPVIYYDVHNEGSVALLASSANDLDVVNAARVSFNVTHDRLEQGDDKLIAYLMKNHHGTPFEHTFLKFRVVLPIFVVREWHRHRIGHSYNEMSGRYTELPERFYLPESAYVRRRVGKAGAYKYEPVEEYLADIAIELLEDVAKHAFSVYKVLLDMGIAPEVARTCLPVSTYTEMIWSVNARSLMAFLSLRAEEHAQAEIQDYAAAVEQIFSKTMPMTYNAWNNNGRVAP